MSGISIESIATMPAVGRTPPASAAKGRFAGLIADLSAHMAVGPLMEGELPIGAVLPGDRQDLAGDAGTADAKPDAATDDDDDDALPIGLAAIALPVPAPAPSWKLPAIVVVPPVVAAVVPAAGKPSGDKPADAASPAIPDAPATPAKPVVADKPTPAPALPAASIATAAQAAPIQSDVSLMPQINPPARPAHAAAKPDSAVVVTPPAVAATPVVTPPIFARPIATAATSMPFVPPSAADPRPTFKPLPQGIAIAAVAHDRAALGDPTPAIANRPLAPPPPPPLVIAPGAIAAQIADQNSGDDRPASPGAGAIDAITVTGPAPLTAPATPVVARHVAVAVLPQAVDTGRAEWIETLIDRIDELRGRDGQRETRIRLLPDALGTIDVRIHRDGDRVNVHFAADNPHARALLNEAAPRLMEMAEARGLKLGDTGVRQDSGAQTQFGQPQSGQSRSEQGRRAAFRPTDSQPDATPDEAGARIA